MNKKTLVMALFALLMIGQKAMAQYPNIPADVKAEKALRDSFMNAHSDSAWAVAYPIILKEAREGRPYIPWASRPYDLPQAKIPSFPGAEGGGMYSFGGRGGKVLTVTNLNDDGPGSFRWACEQGGARIIVFNVSGIIRLKSTLIIRAPYITIAGQTAPGDGVCITGATVWVNTHDVVVRHMRFRRGETWVGDRDDGFGGNPVGNIMLDHLSCSYGLDENISFYRHMYKPGPTYPDVKIPTVNVTIQNSISAKGLDIYNHAFGSTLGGENCSFMRNLWSCNTGRNPSIGWNGVFNFVNNVIYNWAHRSVDGGDPTAMYNIYNNYYKPGPATDLNDPAGHRLVRPDSKLSRNKEVSFGRVYCNGNIIEGNDSVTADNSKGVELEKVSDPKEYLPMVLQKEPFVHPYYTLMTAQQSYDYVLDNVGANFPVRDELDQHIVNEVRTNTPYYAKDAKPDTYQFKYRRLPKDSWKIGIITTPQQYGGLPKYTKKWKARVDTDGDGMPDEWEKANGLNPNDPSDAVKHCNGDGYTNIEKYINGIDTKAKVDWTDMKNNHDTLKGKTSLM